MSNTIGRFEVQSEIAKSSNGSVYKASDPESGQTVALKTLKLDVLGDQAAAVVQGILEEADASKSLNSHNIALLYGAGEIEGLFCASMEYVQGNSIATMLARKEGFSIWDIQDIARQSCQGLDHAHTHQSVHYSLEPAKIMVQWDGTVKLLGFGVSRMGAHAATDSGAAPEVLHYMSPEQLRGDPMDARSNIFSLGAILYEMVTERKAFDGEEAKQVRQSILEMTPVAPDQINRKVHPALSEVVMKALAKNPEERYKSGQELVADLERCKESATKSAATKKAPAQGLKVAGKPVAVPAQAAPKVVAPPKPAPVAARPAPAKPVVEKRIEAPAAQLPVTPSAAPEFEVKAAPAVESEPPAKAAAAAAGWNGGTTKVPGTEMPRLPKLDPTAQFISSCVKASVEALAKEPGNLSAAVVEPEFETPAVEEPSPEELPRLPVDPMMDESAKPSTAGPSFSEMDELPPLKEVYIAPPPPPTEPEPLPEPLPATVLRASAAPEKPKVQPREVAKKAVTEIKKTPPKLFMYSIAGAVGVILLIIVAIAFHIHSENADEDSGPAQAPTAAAPQPAAQPAAPPAPAPVAPAPVPSAVEAVPEPAAEEPPQVSVKPKFTPNSRKKAGKTPAAAPTVIPGELTVNTTPAGAQVTVDGRSDVSWLSPYNMAGLAPGQHTVTVSKAGYGAETRTIEVASAGKSVLVVQLAQLAAQASISSDPPGASIILDGKDTGHVTPMQLAVDKPGSHTLLLRKAGYLDETATANLQSGQTFHFAPTLRALGQTDDIKTVSKFKKVFGGGDVANMGTVSIKTNPKGAQIAVNRRIVDRASPVEFYLNPGTYEVDITFSGYRSLHRVINVDKGGKVVIDEALERQ
jgi:eukaryotic-like serine/threonine-protein kinase